MRNSLTKPCVTILQKISDSPIKWRKIRPESQQLRLIDSQENPISSKLTQSWWRLAIKFPKSKLSRIFLPEGYPESVNGFYLPFVSWNFIQMVLESASGVLSTQSLLYGLGLSNSGLVLSSTLNWILKDGLGQIGGIWAVSYLGGRFDIEAKRYRLLASLLLKLSCILEILVPLFPKYFVLTASLANVLKNVCWMASSATRAQIHRHMARRDNLGDISGKAASQNTLASLIGTGIGILLSTIFLSDQLASPTETVLKCLVITTPLSLLSLVATYQSCLYAISPRLSLQRLEIIFYQTFAELFGKTKTPRLEVLQTLKRYIFSPEMMSTKEPFIFTHTLGRLIGPLGKVHLIVEPLIIPSSKLRFDLGRKFWIQISSQPNTIISIWFSDDADESSRFKGILCLYVLKYFIALNVRTTLEEAEEIAESISKAYQDSLRARGWNLEEIHLGPRRPIKLVVQD